MSAVGVESKSLNESTLREIMIRWKLSQMYLNADPAGAERGRLALETLILRDIPVLLREAARHNSGAV